jgi:hypothetical protein
LKNTPGARALGSCLAAWQPCAPAEAFAARHGFALLRHFWLMDRPRGPVAEPAWPPGIAVRLFDGSDRSVADWDDAYNRSFADRSEGYEVARTRPIWSRAVNAR